MKKVKVCKFGGTSMANATTIRQVASIITSDEERKYIVVSAPGKQHKDDIKVTDLLYRLADEIINEKEPTTFTLIRERFLKIAEDLELSFSMKDVLDQLLNDMIEDGTLDFIVSRGEYLSARILADVLKYEFIDSTELIKFRGSKLDYNATNKASRKYLKTREYVVIGGFYGATSRGDVKILTRGGSDVTGALIARAVNAKVYENWTDIDGFLMCDPRIVDHPKLIEAMTYKELRALSFMGASVLGSKSDPL